MNGIFKEMGRRIVIALMLLFSLFTFGCKANATQPKNPFLIKKEATHIYRIIDLDTGVNYIMINSKNKIAICPRYVADGSLYVEEPER